MQYQLLVPGSFTSTKLLVIHHWRRPRYACSLRSAYNNMACSNVSTPVRFNECTSLILGSSQVRWYFELGK